MNYLKRVVMERQEENQDHYMGPSELQWKQLLVEGVAKGNISIGPQ